MNNYENIIKNRKERLQAIIHEIMVEGTTNIERLAEHYSVSTATIRRDLKLLEQSGQIAQTVGGGVLYKKNFVGPSKKESFEKNINEKLKIAEYCTTLINEQETVIIGPGAITFLAGKILSGLSIPFRIVTNSLGLAMELSGVSNIKTVILGGEIEGEHSTGYEDQAEYFDNIQHADKLLLTADGIDLKYGLTYFNTSYLSIMRKMIHTAKETILIADSSKFGKICFNYLADLTNMSLIITDSNVNKNTAQAIRNNILNMIIVE